MISFILRSLEHFGDPIAILLVVAGVVSFFYIPLIGRHIAVGCLVAAATLVTLHHSYQTGLMTERASWQARLAAETKRRQDVLVQSQLDSENMRAELESTRSQNQSLLQEIDRASHANDDRVCLDVDGVRRLQAIGRGR